MQERACYDPNDEPGPKLRDDAAFSELRPFPIDKVREARLKPPLDPEEFHGGRMTAGFMKGLTPKFENGYEGESLERTSGDS